MLIDNPRKIFSAPSALRGAVVETSVSSALASQLGPLGPRR